VTSGSPSVRCGSTTVAGANFAFQVEYDGFGVTVVGFVVEPGAPTAGAATGETVNAPV
jgi:hypothetical protein